MSKRVKIDAVLVLYRVTAEESESLRALRAAFEESPELAAELGERLRLLVYDNTPGAQGTGAGIQAGTSEAIAFEIKGAMLRERMRYVRDAANGGLVAAYSKALSEAGDAEWLLLLDQDTTLTAEYLREAMRLADELAADASVGAIVPKLRSGGKVRSPHRALGWAQAPLGEEFRGRATDAVTAYNSGALLRVSAMRELGGFPPGFWLDYLDHATFAELRQAGKSVWVMEAQLEHAMSWEDPEREMTVERYRGVLAAEERYHRRYGSWGTAAAFRLRMLKKAIAYAGWKDKSYARLSLRAAMGGGHRDDWERE